MSALDCRSVACLALLALAGCDDAPKTTPASTQSRAIHDRKPLEPFEPERFVKRCAKSERKMRLGPNIVYGPMSPFRYQGTETVCVREEQVANPEWDRWVQEHARWKREFDAWAARNQWKGQP